MARDTSIFNSIRYSQTQPLEGSELVRLKKVLNLIGTGKTVLDVGCWDGSISLLIKAEGNNVYGLENSHNAVQSAIAKDIPVKQFNLEEDKWPDFGFEFDVVFAGEILEHIFDTDKFLQNIQKMLKDNGFLVLTTPNIASLGRRIMLLFGINPLIETTAREYDAGHIRYFTKKGLFKLLEENGFEVKNFESDVINFTNSGRYYTRLIPQIFPTLGRTLIVKAAKRN